MLKLTFSTNRQIQHLKKILYYDGLNFRFLQYNFKDSFQFKLLTYFEEKFETYKISQQNSVSNKLRENLPETKILKTKLSDIDESINQLSCNIGYYSRREIMEHINEECISIIHLLEPLEISILLSKLLKNFSIKNKLTRISFYDIAFTKLLDDWKIESLNVDVVIHLFYILSMKRENKILCNYFKPYLPSIDGLPLIEQSAISIAYYRSGATINYKESLVFNRTLEENAEKLLHNQELLVSICKALRVSTLGNDINLEKFNKCITESKYSMSFTTIAHVIALYAYSNFFEANVIKRITQNAINSIKQDLNVCNIRLKDFARYMWACSHLIISFSTCEKNLLIMYLRQRFRDLSMEKDGGYLVDVLLSIHMLQFWDRELIKQCIQTKIFETIINKKMHWKNKIRLNILLTQINLEMKINIPTHLKKIIRNVYESSPNLNLIQDVGYELCKNGIINKVIMEYPISSIFIPGVTFVTDKVQYHIDIINNSTHLQNNNRPNGLMNLKIRLLSELKYRHILISKRVFENEPNQLKSEIFQEILNIINYQKSTSELRKSNIYRETKEANENYKNEKQIFFIK